MGQLQIKEDAGAFEADANVASCDEGSLPSKGGRGWRGCGLRAELRLEEELQSRDLQRL